MALFAISDLHLSLSGNKPMDIFRGWENYVNKLETNWNRLVRPSDTVVIPGDISWEMKLQNTVTDFDFINQLPGRKIILKGNHDLWWESAAKMQRFFDEHGFDIRILHNNCHVAEGMALAGSRGWFFDDTAGADKKVLLREAGRVDASLKEAEQTGLPVVLFLHYPPVTTEAVCSEMMEVIHRHHVTRCYYGHIHKAGSYKAVNGIVQGVEFRCVSCDMLGFSPLQIRI